MRPLIAKANAENDREYFEVSFPLVMHGRGFNGRLLVIVSLKH